MPAEIGYSLRRGRGGSLDCMWGVQTHSGPPVFLVLFRKDLARMNGTPQPNQKRLPALGIEPGSLDHESQPLTIGPLLTPNMHICYWLFFSLIFLHWLFNIYLSQITYWVGMSCLSLDNVRTTLKTLKINALRKILFSTINYCTYCPGWSPGFWHPIHLPFRRSLFL